MANPPIDTADSVFQKHAVYIFKALQTVQTCVVVDGTQLATEPGFPKASSVQMQISRIAARWGLNIRATTGGGAGDVGGVRAPRGEVTPRKRKQLAVKWCEESGDDEGDTSVGVGVAEVTPSAKARKSPRTPKVKKKEPDFVYGSGEEIDERLETVPGAEEGSYEVWNRRDKKKKEDVEEGDATDGIRSTETVEVAETIEVE